MLYDFHTHSFLSDGVLLPSELIRRAHVKGYGVIAVTDHAGPGNVEEVVDALRRECEVVNRYWQITALPGVELTHIPAASIPEVARRRGPAGPGRRRTRPGCGSAPRRGGPGWASAG